MTEAVAVRLTGVPTAGDILADFARRGYFVKRVESAPPVFEFHRLFQEFLVGCGEQRLGPGRSSEVRRTVGEILESAGQSENAIRLYREAGAWPEAARLICREAPALLRTGRAQTVLDQVAALPEEIREGSGWLLIALGSARALLHPCAPPAELSRAFELFQAAGDARGAYLAWAVIVEVTLQALQDLSPLDHWITVLDELQRRHPDLPDPEVEARVVGAAVGAFSHRQPWHPALSSWLERGDRIALAPGEASLRLSVGRALCLHYGGWGTDVARARRVVDALQPLASDRTAGADTAALWWVAIGLTEAHAGRFIAADQAVERGLAIAASTGLHDHDALLLQVRTLCACGRGALDEAAAFLAQMVDAHQSPSLLAQCVYHHLASLLARLEHRPDAARGHGKNRCRAGLVHRPSRASGAL